jgi:Polyketide cyclase / dehydrase and lipid transport
MPPIERRIDASSRCAGLAPPTRRSRTQEKNVTMVTMSAAVCIEAPSEKVWARLAKLEDLPLWSDAVRHATCDGHPSHGVGAQRRCELGGNVTIHERWLTWDEGRSFSYEGSGIPLVRRAVNRWSVRPEPDGRTLLLSEADVELRGGLLGRLVEPLLVPLFRRMGRQSLAAFKYLVEEGRPYPGKHSALPRAPAIC